MEYSPDLYFWKIVNGIMQHFSVTAGGLPTAVFGIEPCSGIRRFFGYDGTKVFDGRRLFSCSGQPDVFPSASQPGVIQTAWNTWPSAGHFSDRGMCLLHRNRRVLIPAIQKAGRIMKGNGVAVNFAHRRQARRIMSLLKGFENKMVAHALSALAVPSRFQSRS